MSNDGKAGDEVRVTPARGGGCKPAFQGRGLSRQQGQAGKAVQGCCVMWRYSSTQRPGALQQQRSRGGPIHAALALQGMDECSGDQCLGICDTLLGVIRCPCETTHGAAYACPPEVKRGLHSISTWFTGCPYGELGRQRTCRSHTTCGMLETVLLDSK